MGTNILLPLVLGIGFGIALQKGGLTRYKNIVGVFRFTNLTVIKFMLTAVITAMIGLYTLQGLGLVKFPNVPATYLAGNLIGGLIFGLGMGLAGYCPGTCAAGAGEGRVDYLVSGVLGLIAGAVLFGATYSQVFTRIVKLANYGPVTMPQLWNVNPYLMAAVFVVFTLLLFYKLERGWQRKDSLEEEN